MFDNLNSWLKYIETIHPLGIDMGLDRLLHVKDLLDVKFNCPVITVGGTNWKGSTCAYLESIFLEAGLNVGLHISPEILKFNERARINSAEISDDALIKGFEYIEKARLSTSPSISLTYFEFTTLAILYIFSKLKLDVVVLEVGLGGRLDAMNAIDNDCSIITSVDLDHMNYLGNTRELIGYEKAGIFRKKAPAICAEPNPPKSVIQYASLIQADLRLVNKDFSFKIFESNWHWKGREMEIHDIPFPKLTGEHQLRNASAALACVETLRNRLSISHENLRKGIANAYIPGRFQIISNKPTIILDVGHNPHATKSLAINLLKNGSYTKTHAIIGMMADKDIKGTIDPLVQIIDEWHCVDLPSPRGAKGSQISEIVSISLTQNNLYKNINTHNSAKSGYSTVLKKIKEDERLIIFGSFVTVANILEIL